jgi:GMP synthase-like glutamine amidotransferase
MRKKVALLQCRSDAVHRALELEEFRVTGNIAVTDLDAYGLTYARPGPLQGELMPGFIETFRANADQYCAIIIGGSSDHNLSTDPVQKTDDLVFIFSNIGEVAARNEIPIYAACLGGHVGAYAAGVPVQRGYGELGPVEIILTEEGMKDPIFRDIACRTEEQRNGQAANHFYTHTGHGDAVLVDDISGIDGTVLLAYNVVNNKRIVQALRVKDDNYWVQFHAESWDRSTVEGRWDLGGYDHSNTPVLPTELSGTIFRNFLREAGYKNK